MKKTLSSLIFIFVIMFTMIFPIASFAQSGLVPCGVESYGENETVNGEDVSYQLKDPCGYNDIFDLINNVTNFLIFVLALPIAAIMFTYSGFLFAFSGVQPEARSKAKKIFGNVVFGFILSVAAWLIVHTLLSILGYNGSWIGL